jgi:Zn-dependent protease
MDGRLSLNPLAHLDPLGTLMLLLAGFGWGKPVPINPSYFKHRSDELKVAIAGITANIIIAFILGIPVRIALLNGNLPDSIVFLHFLNGMIYANLLLAAFNLIPIFPLDGSHFIEYFLDDYGRMVFQQYGPFLLLFLLIADRLGSFSIISTIIEPIIRVFSLIATGTWSVFIK